MTISLCPQKSLYIDPRGGMSGDMFLAGLCALGFDADILAQKFKKAGFDIAIKAEPVNRKGLAGFRMFMDWPADQPLRHLPDILAILARLDIPDTVRAQSTKAFNRLAQVEAEVHGMPVEKVHFHEVGAMDTLVDIVGAFLALETLSIPFDRVISAPLPWFTGTINCAHGEIPLPAPATAKLMQDKPVYPTDADYELITPTGALLIDCLCRKFFNGPSGIIQKSSFAFGSQEQGLGLRLFLCDNRGHEYCSVESEYVWVLQSNIDHLTGEELGAFFERLMEHGALDVFYQPGVMKKNRPAGAFTVICRPGDLDTVQRAFFANTLTLGIRRSLVERVCLTRSSINVKTSFGEVAAKEFILDGRRLVSPEYESLTRISRERGCSVAELRFMFNQEIFQP